jgi:hypothetical protein
MIRVRCPHCQSAFDLPNERSGQVQTCAQCKKLMRVPLVAGAANMPPSEAKSSPVSLPQTPVKPIVESKTSPTSAVPTSANAVAPNPVKPVELSKPTPAVAVKPPAPSATAPAKSIEAPKATPNSVANALAPPANSKSDMPKPVAPTPAPVVLTPVKPVEPPKSATPVAATTLPTNGQLTAAAKVGQTQKSVPASTGTAPTTPPVVANPSIAPAVNSKPVAAPPAVPFASSPAAPAKAIEPPKAPPSATAAATKPVESPQSAPAPATMPLVTVPPAVANPPVAPTANSKPAAAPAKPIDPPKPAVEPPQPAPAPTTLPAVVPAAKRPLVSPSAKTVIDLRPPPAPASAMPTLNPPAAMSSMRVIPTAQATAESPPAATNTSPLQDITPIAEPLCEPSHLGGKETWLQYSKRSQIYQHELKQLEARPVPELGLSQESPIPTPPATAEFGAVTAVLHFPAEHSTLKIAGGAFLLVAALLIWVVAAALFFSELVTIVFAIGAAVAFGVVLALGGVAMMALNKTRDQRTFWTCERGIVWQYGSVVNACKWESLTEIYLERQDGKLAYAIKLGDQPALFSDSHPDAIAFAEYVVHKAAATLFVRLLKRVIRGEEASLGNVDLNRRGLRWDGQFTEWQHVASVSLDGDAITIDLKEAGKSVVLPQSQIAHAPVVLALCRCIVNDKLHDKTTSPPGADVNRSPFSY